MISFVKQKEAVLSYMALCELPSKSNNWLCHTWQQGEGLFSRMNELLKVMPKHFHLI